jgi:hypothetical protein
LFAVPPSFVELNKTTSESGTQPLTDQMLPSPGIGPSGTAIADVVQGLLNRVDGLEAEVREQQAWREAAMRMLESMRLQLVQLGGDIAPELMQPLPGGFSHRTPSLSRVRSPVPVDSLEIRVVGLPNVQEDSGVTSPDTEELVASATQLELEDQADPEEIPMELDRALSPGVPLAPSPATMVSRTSPAPGPSTSGFVASFPAVRSAPANTPQDIIARSQPFGFALQSHLHRSASTSFLPSVQFSVGLDSLSATQTSAMEESTVSGMLETPPGSSSQETADQGEAQSSQVDDGGLDRMDTGPSASDKN